MKIDLGGGAYIEPDEGDRDTAFHMEVKRSTPIPNTKTGHYLDLACGHRVMTFGRLALAGGRVLCTQCRDAAEGNG